MGGAELDGARPEAGPDVASLLPMLRRIVFSRVQNQAAAEDLVQETLVKVLAAANRIEPGMLEPYAITTARNLIASMWRSQDRHRRNQHRVVEMDRRRRPGRTAAQGGGAGGRLRRARAPLRTGAEDPAGARGVRTGHQSLAAELGSTAGAVAAQLNRTRARLRVEYLLALHDTEPPTDRCRPVLFALSGGDRRRQREVDAARHLLECDLCARLSQPLLEPTASSDDNEVRIDIQPMPTSSGAQERPRAGRAAELLPRPT